MINKSEDKRRTVQIVDLEGLVPQDHLLRKIDRAIYFTHINVYRAVNFKRQYISIYGMII